MAPRAIHVRFRLCGRQSGGRTRKPPLGATPFQQPAGWGHLTLSPQEHEAALRSPSHESVAAGTSRASCPRHFGHVASRLRMNRFAAWTKASSAARSASTRWWQPPRSGISGATATGFCLTALNAQSASSAARRRSRCLSFILERRVTATRWRGRSAREKTAKSSARGHPVSGCA